MKIKVRKTIVLEAEIDVVLSQQCKDVSIADVMEAAENFANERDSSLSDYYDTGWWCLHTSNNAIIGDANSDIDSHSKTESNWNVVSVSTKE